MAANGLTDALYQEILDHLKLFGCTVEKTIVSRVDLCVDAPGVDIREVAALLETDCYVTRARKHNSYTDKSFGVEGFTIGSSKAKIKFRAYCKARELEQKKDEQKAEIVRVVRWGGKHQEHATRFEFQLRREAIKQLGIDTIEDYFEKRQGLALYLVEKFLRFTDKPVSDRKRGDESKPHPIWVRVRDAFEQSFGSAVKCVMRELKARGNKKVIQNMGLGCILELVAQKVEGPLEKVYDLHCIVMDVVGEIMGMHIEERLMLKMQAKQRKGEARFARSALGEVMVPVAPY